MPLSEESPTSSTDAFKSKAGRSRYIIVALVLVLVGGGFWYFFFGKKPRVVMTIPVKETGRDNGCWAAGQSEVLLVTSDAVKLCDLKGRAEKWSVKLPPQPVLDLKNSERINTRLAKLQQWADELAVKRAALKTQEETLSFNQEVAKYQAESLAARAAATAPPPGKQAAVPAPPVAQSEPPHVLGGDRSKLDKLNLTEHVDAKLLDARIKKRAAKISALATSIETKRAGAKTDFQKNVIKEEEKQMAALAGEQKADENALVKLNGKPAPEPVVEAVPEVARVPVRDDDTEELAPKAVFIGDTVWIVDGTHVVALDRASGSVKQDVPLAGAARQVFSGEKNLFVLARAGAEAQQITRLAAGVPPQSLFLVRGPDEEPFITSANGWREANVQALHVEFGGDLVRADIRLIERRLKAPEADDADTQKKLAQMEASGKSKEEIQAISKLIANDAQRLRKQARELIDDSTYEVTLRRPFEPAIPAWTGRMRGRVHIVSTPQHTFLTAGTQLFAFTPDNKKIWEATLGAPLPVRTNDGGRKLASTPCFEAGGKLYFADGGALSCFDIASGHMQWRMPNTGIRKLQSDVDGNIYVASDNSPFDSLASMVFSDASFESSSVLKVSATTGEILWKAERHQDVWVSGKDVYTFREMKGAIDFQNSVFDRSKVAEARIRIYKLSRADGKEKWDWYATRRPRAVVADGSNVAVLFGDEFQVVHSIAF